MSNQTKIRYKIYLFILLSLCVFCSSLCHIVALTIDQYSILHISHLKKYFLILEAKRLTDIYAKSTQVNSLYCRCSGKQYLTV